MAERPIWRGHLRLALVSEARLREVIDAKLKGEGIAPEEPIALRTENVIDLMSALKRSLGQGGKSRAQHEAPSQRRKSSRSPKDGKRATKRPAARKHA
jgi:DNA end-binding protein Ku